MELEALHRYNTALSFINSSIPSRLLPNDLINTYMNEVKVEIGVR